jgi:dolichol-phosphate mannosyltransferase
MENHINYSFVVPAFNEEQNITLLYDRICALTEKFNQAWELIFINDGSRDRTLEVIKQLSEKDARVKYIDLSRNFGHQAALSAGLHHAQGTVIISMDCDLQDPPEIIEQMIEKHREGYDIVYARRLNYRKDSLLKRLGSQFYYRIMGKYTNVEIPRNVGDFRLVTRAVQDEINRMPEHSRYLRGMVAWTGFRFTFVDYYRPDREKGISGYTIGKLASLGMDGMVNFSVLPLRVGMLLGVFTILIGMGLFAYQVADVAINGVYYHLYKWLVVLLFILMGFLFLLLWIIGEYIGKIYDEVRKRPLYVIREKGNF